MSDAPLRKRTGWLRALWAGFLSLVMPGLGQVYAGTWRLGAMLFAGAIAVNLSWIAFTWRVPPTPGAVAGCAGVVLLFYVAAAIDAARRVRLRPTASNPWYRSTWLAAPVMAAINIGLQSIDAITYPPGWRSFHIASASNLPTLLTTDYVLADIRAAGTAPAYGDIVAFRNPRDPKVDYVKRVIGLPGDRVQLREGILYLNGKPVPREAEGFAMPFFSAPRIGDLRQYRETLPNGRSYMIVETPQSASESTVEFNVPSGSFFVLGDNRGNSLDSRHNVLGFIPIPNVIGTVRTIYWSSLYEPDRFLSPVR